MRPRKKLNFTIRYVLLFGALLLAANILLGIVLFNQSRHTLREMLEKNMLDITNTAAGLMDGDRLGALTEADVGGPYFNEVIQTLSVFQDRVEIEFIYAVRQVGPQEFVFTVDPDPVDPGQFGEEVLFTYALGEAGKGIATVDSAAAADRWGNFYSAYSPVFDSAGKVAGIIGVDFGADWYEHQLRGLTRTVSLITILMVLIGAAVIFLITNRTQKRFRDLSNELAVLSGDVDELTTVIVSTPGYEASALPDRAPAPDAGRVDEIGILSEKIRLMEGNVKRYLDYAHRQASTDALTGVGNTTAYQSRTAALDALGDAAAYTIAIFDVDRLKRINDDLGHASGDMVIRAAGIVLSRVFGAENVYRIGGDEFLSVAEGTDEAEMAGLLRRVEDAAAQFTMADKRCDGLLSLSSGAAAFRPGKGECFHTVFVRADEAMYRTKAEHHDAAAR